MAKTVGGRIDRELVEKYNGEIISRLNDEESTTDYYFRITRNSILPKHGGKMSIAELCAEIAKITKEGIMEAFLLRSLLREGSGIKVEEATVVLIEVKLANISLSLEEKRTIRAIAYKAVRDTEDWIMPLDELCSLVVAKTGTSYGKYDVLEAISHAWSKLEVYFCKGVAQVSYKEG